MCSQVFEKRSSYSQLLPATFIKLLSATFIGAEFAIKKCKRFTKSILVASAIDVISEFFVSFSVFKITKKKVENHHKK